MVRLQSKRQRAHVLVVDVNLSLCDAPCWLFTLLQRYMDESHVLETEEKVLETTKKRRMDPTDGALSSSSSLPHRNETDGSTSASTRVRNASSSLFYYEQELNLFSRQVGKSLLDQWKTRLRLLGGAMLCSPSSWEVLGTSWELIQPYIVGQCATRDPSHTRELKNHHQSNEEKMRRKRSRESQENGEKNVSVGMETAFASSSTPPLPLPLRLPSSSFRGSAVLFHQSLCFRVLLTSPVVLRARNCGTHSTLLRVCRAALSLLHHVHLCKEDEEVEEERIGVDENERAQRKADRYSSGDSSASSEKAIVPVSVRLSRCSVA